MSGYMKNKAGALIYHDTSKHTILDVTSPCVHRVLTIGYGGSPLIPLVTIKETDGSVIACRIPHQLYAWALYFFKSISNNKNPFPSDVEFGTEDGCVYAEIV